ncbi:MAG: CsbD family protein [Halobacteriales archaeon]|nr:CsbD family protein [Halobacteriales archaeon]
MAEDREIGGTYQKAKGKVNEEVGKLTGNPEQEMKGRGQQVTGDIEKGVGKFEKGLKRETND